MTVYADVLILVNAVIDYFLILLTSKLTGTYLKNYRIIFGAFVGSLFSLLIFLPYMGAVAEILISFISAFIIVIVAFGTTKIMKNTLTYIAVGFIYNGLMTSLWAFFKPKGMILNNSVVYFNISPLLFIFLTVIFYILIRLICYIISKKSKFADRCSLKFMNDNNCIEITALVDTGNSLKDPYTNKQVIITDDKTATLILGKLDMLSPILLPVSSVEGDGLITAYPFKNVQINGQKSMSVLLAVSKHGFEDDYKAIVNPEILI